MTGAAWAWAATILFLNGISLAEVRGLMKIRLFGRRHTRAVLLPVLCFGVAALVGRYALGADVASLLSAAGVATGLYVAALYVSRDLLELPTLLEALRIRRAASAADADASIDAQSA